MTTSAKPTEEQIAVQRYEIPHPITAYTFPETALIHQVRFDDENMVVDLSDGRRLSVPLWWIPTLLHAAPEERLKFEISRDRTALIWDPEKCAINEDLRIADYLGPSGAEDRAGE